jgi:ABC-type transport system involved in cytochrome c biogenesis permease subunit
MKRWLPLILTAVMASWFLGTLRAPGDKDFDYAGFGRLPLLFNGRLQPMDSLARNSLRELRDKQTLNLEPWKGWNEKPKIIPAIEWLANVMMNPDAADQWPAFRVDNPELIALLKLPGKDAAQHQDGKHYSWNQIQPALDVLDRENQRIEKIEDVRRDAFERAVVKMHNRLLLYVRLKNTLQPADAQDWAAELADYERVMPAGVAALRAEQANRKYDETVYNQFMGFARKFNFMAQLDPPLLVPPTQPEQSRNDWSPVGRALLSDAAGGTIAPSVRSYAAMATAFKQGDADGFNRQLAGYRAFLKAVPQCGIATLKKADYEVFFNRMEPFYKAMVIYVLAGLLACLSWFGVAATPPSQKVTATPRRLNHIELRRDDATTLRDEGVAATWSETLRRSAIWLVGLAFVIHTAGLIYRMALEGRPPVTNLYSSAIFIGWGAVVLGLVLERFHKNGIGAFAASGIGFLTLIIAHNLSLGGDTMEMMQAVLDTNFWLATHVVVVTLGYASTFVAGFLALIYILRGVFTKTLDEATGKSLARMVYGIVCFATLFSFVGTVLGGIWADQSWGRFWGWDPKENGALIIVLWNALVLHLRWGGMIRERGLINCAVFGNVVTSWSWFGVNMLGIGLHSYGFTDAAFKWLMLFVGSQVGFIVLGLLPGTMWKSVTARTRLPQPGTGQAK